LAGAAEFGAEGTSAADVVKEFGKALALQLASV
jgi:hypothetical protein